MAEENVIIVENKDGIRLITLNRPRALNALNWQVMTELGKIVQDAQSDATVRVMVLTGAGKAFAAGADIIEMVGKDGKGMGKIAHHYHGTIRKIYHSVKPIIAAINGFALGGGLEIAMASHIRIIADTAAVGLPEVGLGAVPGAGGTQFLPRLIGRGAALYYLLTGENIRAADALRLGLVQKVVPLDELMVTAMAIAKVITQKGSIAASLIIEGVDRGEGLEIDKAFAIEEDLQRRVGDTEDFQEATKAFSEKRPITFNGR